jgi:hypothetical protein
VAVNAARIHALEARVEMNRRVATINTLIHGMAGIEGKKLLVLASHRLGEYTGAEFYYAAGITDTMIPALERADLDNRPAVRSIIANANASGVTIYPVFPTGLDYTPPIRARTTSPATCWSTRWSCWNRSPTRPEGDELRHVEYGQAHAHRRRRHVQLLLAGLSRYSAAR